MAHHFGNWIKSRREKLSYTQSKLALEIGVSLATIRNWERTADMPRISVPIKAALAEALRLSLVDLEAIGRGDRADAPMLAAPAKVQEIRPMIQIENYDRAKVLLRGVAKEDFTVRHTGHLPHKFAPAHVREFAWIMEDDSMDGPTGYRVGDVIVFIESTSIPPGSDVMVQVGGRYLGIVRRIFYEADKSLAILFALNTKFPPQSVSLKDVSMMAMAIAVFRAI